jgi:hypothetical protein
LFQGCSFAPPLKGGAASNDRLALPLAAEYTTAGRSQRWQHNIGGDVSRYGWLYLYRWSLSYNTLSSHQILSGDQVIKTKQHHVMSPKCN